MQIRSNGIVVPSIFEENYFTKALQNALEQVDFKIYCVSIEMGVNPGDNYCSIIYRTGVEFQRKSSNSRETVNLLIKCPLSGKTMDFLEFLNCFRKERITFTEVLPVMQSLLKDSKLTAKCFHTTESPTESFVFEDLKVWNYTLPSRKFGLDLNHAELVMKKIAEFHATSLVMVKRNPSIVENYHEGLLGRNAIRDSSCLANIYKGILETLLPFCKKWDGFDSIIPKLQKYIENYRENLIKTGAQRTGEFRVLNHGDLWLTNMMFKYDSATRKPIDVIFVDLQMSIYAAPGIDLNYFFNTSLALDVLKSQREYLIKVYYDKFKLTLESIGYSNIPTFETVRKEISNREDYGFFGAHAIFPLASQDEDSSESIDCDILANPDSGKKRMEITFSTTKFQEHMKYVLKRFDDIGLFERF